MTNFCTARITLVALLALSVGAVSLTACGDDRRVPGGGGIVEANVAAQVAAAACATAFRCCEPGMEIDAILDGVVATNEADCRTEYTARLRTQYTAFGPFVTGGTIVYDGVAAEDCVGAFRAVACGGFLRADTSLAVCRTIYSGTRAEGESCADDEECMPLAGGALYCGSDSTCTVGYLEVPVGSACGGSTSCASGGFCDASVCVAGRSVGGTCTGSEQCASHICTGGVCAASPSRPLGDPCVSGTECASGACDCGDTACASLVCVTPICDGV